MNPEETIFTKIIKREIPADIVYEDDISIAFMDIFPVTKGHILLISKDPYRWMQDVPDEVLGKMFITTKKLMIAVKNALGCDMIHLTVEGKEVPHFHIHLIPRYFDDKLIHWPKTSYESDSEKIEYLNKIKNAL